MIVDVVLGSWAGLLNNAAQLGNVLDRGRPAVYEWLAEVALDTSASAIPAVQTALASCDAIAESVPTPVPLSCRSAIVGVMVRVIADVCHAIGLDYVIDYIIALWNAVPQWVKDGVGYVVDGVAYLLESGVDGAVQLGKAAWSWVSDADTYIAIGEWLEEELYQRTIGRLGRYLGTALDDAERYALELVASAKKYLEDGVESVVNALDSAYDSTLGVVILTLDDTAREIANAITNATEVALEAISDAAVAVADAVSDAAVAVGDAIASAGEEVWDVITFWD